MRFKQRQMYTYSNEKGKVFVCFFLKQKSEHFCAAGALCTEHHQTKEPYWGYIEKSFFVS